MKRPQTDAPTVEAVREAYAAEAEKMDDRPWLEMKDAPMDGTLIEYEDGKYARYRITRRRMERRWKTIGFWADAFTAEEVDPARWRLPEGFAMPGMVI
jgi:hypothetical protein